MSQNFQGTNSLFLEFTGQIVKDSVELSEALVFSVHKIQAYLIFRTGMTPKILYSITEALTFLRMVHPVEKNSEHL